jgi:uncharacterized membrane protein
MELIIAWLKASWIAVNMNRDLMIWNTFLAVVPLGLSVWLFRWRKPKSNWPRSPFWWLLFATFVGFLPNAPYILTDIIHYIKLIRWGMPDSIVIFALTPQFFLFLTAGWQCYVISLINLGYYLEQRQRQRWILPAELVSHFLSAIGIYLGRFLRWNTWDVVTRPDDLGRSLARTLSQEKPLLAIGVTFVILTLFYWPTKQINLGLALRWQQLLDKNKPTPPTQLRIEN